MQGAEKLFEPLQLPCGAILKNRIVKAAMSDSLGDGTGHPTPSQGHLYRLWAEGGQAAAIVGEVQAIPFYPERPGNLVLNDGSELSRFEALAAEGARNGAQLWLQLGHAGALAFARTGRAKGPSRLDYPELQCDEMTAEEIRALPEQFARTARLARQASFAGVQVHAAHGFLLSQFLSPLFNHRSDDYGGSIGQRMRPLLETIAAVREAVGPEFPISVKLNSSDQLQGGLLEADALKVVAALEKTTADLIDISGGTYFPGAKAASDGAGKGPYFLGFALRARNVTSKPLMLTGGFRTRQQAEEVLANDLADVVGLARALVLEPNLPDLWRSGKCLSPEFPRFTEAPKGGVTAWYTMRLTDLAVGRAAPEPAATGGDLSAILKAYEKRDEARARIWLEHFGRED